MKMHQPYYKYKKPSIMPKLFATAAVVVCAGLAMNKFQDYQRKNAPPPLSAAEIKARDNHIYWDKVAATTNVCTQWPQSSMNVYDEMPAKLKAIPTDNIDPDTVMAVQKYLAPGLARSANYEHMKAELPLKLLITGAAAIATFGGSEIFDGLDALDGLDAIFTAADVADDFGTAATFTDVAGEAIDIAELTDVSDLVDAAQLASITDKIEIAGGLESVMGPTPGRGFLGISASIKTYKESKRMPKIQHVVAYRVGRARQNLQKRYGGTFKPLNLNAPKPCS